MGAFQIRGGRLLALNLTVTGSPTGGWARGYPCDQAQPPTSNINFAAGQTVANAALGSAAGNGQWCVSASAPVHVIVDDNGRLGPGDYLPVAGARLFDSRLG